MVEAPKLWQRTQTIWREDPWARRTAYVCATLAAGAVGSIALENIGLGLGFGVVAVWMGYTTFSYFN